MAPQAKLSDRDLANAVLLLRRRTGTWVAAVFVIAMALGMVNSVVNNPRFGWDVVGDYFFSDMILRGLWTTIVLTVIAITISIVIGFIVALAALSGNIVLSSVAKFYIWLFRSIPMLVQIIFWYNLAALYPTMSFGLPFLPPLVEIDTNSAITVWSAAIIALSLNEGAFMAEIVRSGLLSVDSGQREAARSLGISGWSTFFRIILPQSMRVIIPPVGNETISMLKYTTLVSVISLPELLYTAQLISSQNFEVIPMLLVASGWYLICTTILMLAQHRIERHFARSTVR